MNKGSDTLEAMHTSYIIKRPGNYFFSVNGFTSDYSEAIMYATREYAEAVLRNLNFRLRNCGSNLLAYIVEV